MIRFDTNANNFIKQFRSYKFVLSHLISCKMLMIENRTFAVKTSFHFASWRARCDPMWVRLSRVLESRKVVSAR